MPPLYSLAGEFLLSYVGTYLKEEIQAESLVRNLGGFNRFLDVVALMNGEEVNHAAISSDCGVPVRTLSGYFSILDDTLLGFTVEPFLRSKKRKSITRPKYYLFDVGVVNCLTKRGKIQQGSELMGKAFEHFIALELRAWLSYTRQNLTLQYWRSTSQFEVDFVLGTDLAIEVKATSLVTERHLKGLRAFKEEGLVSILGVVSLDPDYRQTKDGIHIWPYETFLTLLWDGKLN